MDRSSVSNTPLHLAAAASTDLVSVVETPIIGRAKARRVTTTCKTVEGQIISILIEEYFDTTLLSRQLEQHKPMRSTTKESFESDGSLISSETERKEETGLTTKIVVRGTGKSSTTRILSGEVELRATERSILIETPKASYNFQPFEGKWSSFYKELNMKLELKANFLKSPNSTLNGPDGIKLVFRNGRLVDMQLSKNFVPSTDTNRNVPGILD